MTNPPSNTNTAPQKIWQGIQAGGSSCFIKVKSSKYTIIAGVSAIIAIGLITSGIFSLAKGYAGATEPMNSPIFGGPSLIIGTAMSVIPAFIIINFMITMALNYMDNKKRAKEEVEILKHNQQVEEKQTALLENLESKQKQFERLPEYVKDKVTNLPTKHYAVIEQPDSRFWNRKYTVVWSTQAGYKVSYDKTTKEKDELTQQYKIESGLTEYII
jgi:large-conductance mechanosensitive channel